MKVDKIYLYSDSKTIIKIIMVKIIPVLVSLLLMEFIKQEIPVNTNNDIMALQS